MKRHRTCSAAWIAVCAGSGRLLVCAAIALTACMVLPWIDTGGGEGRWAFLRFALALSGLAALGGTVRTALRLPRTKHLTPLVDALYGQILLLVYLYLRSATVAFLNFPALSAHELRAGLAASFLTAGTAAFTGSRSRSRSHRRRHVGGAVPYAEYASLFLWIVLLGAIFFHLYPRWSTPCSDTDIHAALARFFMNHGGFPAFSPWDPTLRLDYPGGFAALNGGFALLTGLHPVRVVNLQPYLQWLWLLPVWMAVWTPRTVRPVRFTAAFLAILFAGVVVFHPFFPMFRSILTGTARLAHTALFFFPALHLWSCRAIRGRDAQGFWIPVSLAIACAMNPVHLVPMILVTVAAQIVVHQWRKRHLPAFPVRNGTHRAPIRAWAAGIAVAVVMLMHDPGATLWRGGTNEPRWSRIHRAAGDAPGFALRPPAQWQPALRQFLQNGIRTSFWAPPLGHNPAADRAWLRVGGTILLLFAAWQIWLHFRCRNRSTDGIPSCGAFLLLTAAFLLPWSLAITAIADPRSLGGILLHQYTTDLLFQSFWMLAGFMVVAPALFIASRPGIWRHEWKFPVLLGAAIVLPGLHPLLRGDDPLNRIFYMMNYEATAQIQPEDRAAYQWIHRHVPPGDAILLPNDSFQTPWEDWCFPRGPAAGVGHYTAARPVFFYGLCGWNAADYRLRVANGLDLDWMRAHAIDWVFDVRRTPIRPKDEMMQAFEPAYQNPRIRIWRRKPSEK